MLNNSFVKYTPTIVAALVIVAALLFFYYAPGREGVLSFTTPDGTEVTLNVKNGEDITDLLFEKLQNDETSVPLANSLLSLIERLPSDSPFTERLVDLAERRRPPFNFQSIPVELLYANNVPKGLVSVCENSRFSSKNIVIFILSRDNVLLDKFTLYADTRHAIPCNDRRERLGVNLENIDRFGGLKVLAKRTL